jgi:hypothetical protein
MKKYNLIGASIIFVVFLICSSLNNIVGYQAVQASNQKVVHNEIDQKELLFQMTLDIANNREIQKIILFSEIIRGQLFNQDLKFSGFTPNIFTKKYIDAIYHFGLILSKMISISTIHSIFQKYQMSHQSLQKEIAVAIEKNDELKKEIKQLAISNCDCENDNTTQWFFPVLCTLLVPLVWLSIGALVWNHNPFFFNIMMSIGLILHCFWYIGFSITVLSNKL